MAKIIGLAGNIGSGKSLAASILQELGAAVIDADALARLIVEPGRPAHRDIAAAFGEKYLLADGHIHRRELGALIFRDETAREKLNSITHPRIFEEARILIEKYRAENYPLIVLEAALLLETAVLSSLPEEIWLVTAPKAQIHQRLTHRDSLSPEQIEARLSAQMPPEHQAKLADRIIVNEGSVEDFRHKLALLYRHITAMS